MPATFDHLVGTSRSISDHSRNGLVRVFNALAGVKPLRAVCGRDHSGNPAFRRPSASLASLIEQAPRSAFTNRLSGINASASLHRTGPAPHGRGVARLLSDCHAAAVEAREGEAVEGFAEGSALVPQHADSHFLADRH